MELKGLKMFIELKGYILGAKELIFFELKG